MDNIFEVVQEQDDNNYFVAVIDASNGTIIIRGWTPQPVNWLEWSSKIRAEYIRLTRRGVSPARAANAARQTVMAVGPSTTPFVERMALIR